LSDRNAQYNPNHLEVSSQQDDWVIALLQFGKHLVATASLAGILVCSPPSMHPQQAWLHPPSSWAATTTVESSLLVASSVDEQQTQVKEGETVFDEVYNLIDKYYIDRSYGGQVRTLEGKSKKRFS